MVIGWLADQTRQIGGAEISSQALVDQAPDWARVVYCPPDRRPPENIDAFVVQNCVTYGARWIEVLETRPLIKCVRDWWPMGDALLRRWLLYNATALVFSSPLHVNQFGFSFKALPIMVPPPVDLARFYAAAAETGKRAGNVWLGALHFTKGLARAVDWALENDEPLDVYGPGRMRDIPEAGIRHCGVVAPKDVPGVLARYERFVFLPGIRLEPFGRTVVEAWAAGCELVLDRERIGACWWLEPDQLRLRELQRAGEMFWDCVSFMVRRWCEGLRPGDPVMVEDGDLAIPSELEQGA